MHRFSFVRFIFALLICSLAACKNEAPSLSVPDSKMVQILVDVHIAEAAMQNLSIPTKDSLTELYYSQIFEIHNITPEQFQKDMDFIKHDPLTLERLYDRVMEVLGEEEAALHDGSEKKNKNK